MSRAKRIPGGQLARIGHFLLPRLLRRKAMKIRLLVLLCALSFVQIGITDVLQAQPQELASARRVIVFVWDGLRADDLTPEITPNYFALARSGVLFKDHHAVYPTFTMMNSASIATGTYPGTHGFYGNVVYAPNARGKNAKGVAIDFAAPAFIEDFGVVEAVRDSYQRSEERGVGKAG